MVCTCRFPAPSQLIESERYMNRRPLAVYILLALALALALTGCTSSGNDQSAPASTAAETSAPPTGPDAADANSAAGFHWKRGGRTACPAPSTVAASRKAHVSIQEVTYLNPQELAVAVQVCPLQTGDLPGQVVDAEAFNQPNQPGRVQFGQGFETDVTIPKGGTTVTLYVKARNGHGFDPAVMPSIGAGTFGTVRPDGTWGNLISNWDQVG